MAVAGRCLLAVGHAGAQEGQGQLAVGFTLVDAAGRLVHSSDFSGKWLLIYFGYTHCSDLCPLGLTTMTAALEQLGPAAEHLQPVFITVDPERDRGAMLQTYTEAFDKRLIGLTGTLDQIENAARLLNAPFSKVRAASDDYVVDHSSAFTLVFPDRRTFRTIKIAEPHLLAAQLIEVLVRADIPLDRVGNLRAYR